jgi:CPA2 family monovalent cation:H+ antiporter-2
MASGVAPGEYKDVVLFLATAGIVVPLFQRLKISPTLGFLAAGVALGPFGLGAMSAQFPWLERLTVSKPDEVAQLAEFGVVFLLFTIGLELSWERLRAMRRMVFGLGALQLGATGVVITGLALAFGQSIPASLAIGAALALSSTAVGLPVLAERKRLQSTSGRAAFSVLLFQDLSVAPILIVLTVVGRGGQTGGFDPKDLLALGPAVLGLLVLVIGGRLLLRPLMKSVARAKSPELFAAASLLIVIGAGLAAAASGLSMALGAFIAGLLLAETEYRHQVELTVEPFKGLLLGLFFVSVGIGLDLSLLVQKPALILGMAAALIVGKTILTFGAARVMGLTTARAIETALVLAAGGEFAFVILNDALATGVLGPDSGRAVLVSATLTMLTIPALAWLGERLGRAKAGEGVGPSVEPAPSAEGEIPRVLIVGYGRVGRLVGEMLSRHDVPWVALERTPRMVEGGRRSGHNLFYGDAARPEMLKRCGLMTAPALVVTMDSPEGVETVVATAREVRPDMIIVARARDAIQAGKLYALGATNAVPETIEASLQLSEAVLVDVGVPMGFVIASIHEKRDEYRALLQPRDGAPRQRRAIRMSTRVKAMNKEPKVEG